jgi:hypothetical protein
MDLLLSGTLCYKINLGGVEKCSALLSQKKFGKTNDLCV